MATPETTLARKWTVPPEPISATYKLIIAAVAANRDVFLTTDYAEQLRCLGALQDVLTVAREQVERKLKLQTAPYTARNGRTHGHA